MQVTFSNELTSGDECAAATVACVKAASRQPCPFFRANAHSCDTSTEANATRLLDAKCV